MVTTTDPFSALPIYPDPQHVLIVDNEDAVADARKMMATYAPKVVGFDIETYNRRTDIWRHVAALFPYLGGKIRTAQIGFYVNTESHAIILDLKKAPEGSYRFLKTLLECPRDKRTIVGHNLAFEFMYMESIGIRTSADIFDTHVAARVLSCNLLPLEPRRGSGYGLDLGSCVGRDLNKNLPKDEQTSDWGAELTPSQLTYAAKDCIAPLDLHAIYTKRLEETGQTEAAQADCRVLPIMAACNASGIVLDVDRVQQTKVELEAEKKRLYQTCCEVLGVDNPNSPAQLLPVFQKLDPSVENTNKQTVEYLARKHPEVTVLIELKKVVKTLGTYIDPWLNMAELTGGTVHPNLKVIGADTGRMSCPTAFKGSVPSGEFTKNGKEKTRTITLGATLHGAPSNTRDFFVARPGHVMIDADFSAIEVRLAAHKYKDPAMIELALNPDIDAHRRMASKIFDVPEEEVTSEQRKIGKTANFALQYGCGVNKLHAQLESVLGRKVDIAEAQKAYETWHETHYMISKQMALFKNKLNPHFFLTSTLGRRMGKPDPVRKARNKWNHRHPAKQALIHTNGVNWPIQSAGRDLLAEAAILLWERLLLQHKDIRPLHLVHDEVLLEVPKEKAEMAAAIIKECMSDADLQRRYLGNIPLECETLVGSRWSECH